MPREPLRRDESAGRNDLFARVVSTSVAATKDPQSPDREMLKMMEFLRQMEMIQKMELLRDMDHQENTGDPQTTAPQKTPPVKKKETVK
jgi:hypothetical protein